MPDNTEERKTVNGNHHFRRVFDPLKNGRPEFLYDESIFAQDILEYLT
jgi:hypothetical protein